ncbi:MAG: hypothetical protein H6Q14_1462 [Bacteroidetes bacterium]|nr:hypothetical protein [Bacteroidota bacterium]
MTTANRVIYLIKGRRIFLDLFAYIYNGISKINTKNQSLVMLILQIF